LLLGRANINRYCNWFLQYLEVLNYCLMITVIHTHAHTPFYGHFSGQPGFVSLNFIYLFTWNPSSWDRPKLLISSLTQSHHIFLRRLFCLIVITSGAVECFAKSVSSFRCTWQNHLNLSQ